MSLDEIHMNIRTGPFQKLLEDRNIVKMKDYHAGTQDMELWR